MKLMPCLVMVVSCISFTAVAQPQDNLPADPAISEPPAEVAADTQTSGEVSDEYAGPRDPFWPVGFSPDSGKKEEEVQEVEVEQAQSAVDEELWITLQKQLKVAGVIAFGNRKMATVNNKNVQVGNRVSIRHENREFRWEVSEITENNRVRFTRLEVVPVDVLPVPEVLPPAPAVSQ